MKPDGWPDCKKVELAAGSYTLEVCFTRSTYQHVICLDYWVPVFLRQAFEDGLIFVCGFLDAQNFIGLLSVTLVL